MIEPYLVNPPRKGGKLRRIMRTAQVLRKQGYSLAQAMKKAWSKNPNEIGGNEMYGLTYVNPRRRRASRKVRKARRVFRAVAANPRKRRRARRNPFALMENRRRRSYRRNPMKGFSFGGLKLPPMMDVLSVAGGAAVTKMATVAVAKAMPNLDTPMMKMLVQAGLAIGGGMVVSMVSKNRRLGAFYTIGGFVPVALDGIEMFMGVAKGGLSLEADDSFPELGLDRRRLGLYTGGSHVAGVESSMGI